MTVAGTLASKPADASTLAELGGWWTYTGWDGEQMTFAASQPTLWASAN